jgi:hypothetical protein
MQIERSAYFIASTITLWNLYWIADKELDKLQPSFYNKGYHCGISVAMLGMISYYVLTPTIY